MMRSGGSSLQTMLPVPDTSKSCKLHPSISNWNYSGLAWVGSARLCPIVIKAISASRQSLSLGLSELGNIRLQVIDLHLSENMYQEISTWKQALNDK